LRKEDLIDQAIEYTRRNRDNVISETDALSVSSRGVKIFDDPLFAFADADDPLFFTLKEPSIIGGHCKLPKEWMAGAESVISFFLPFSEIIRSDNRRDNIWPSAGWLHGRFEGQAFINGLCVFMQGLLSSAGFDSRIPSMESCFQSKSGPGDLQDENRSLENNLPFFTSNWSERHVAMVCGLGSFGLSKNLITIKGAAGRFGSLVTDLKIEPNPDRFESFLSYCRSCGACIERCPANAISFEHGKDHFVCSKFLDRIKDHFRPRHGCGKCQVGVPCESSMPLIRKDGLS
jgi:epoxyqueuosine reductase QueG